MVFRFIGDHHHHHHHQTFLKWPKHLTLLQGPYWRGLMTRKRKCHSESNSFIAAAEKVRLEPVLEHHRRRSWCHIAWQAVPHLCTSSRKSTTSDCWPTAGWNVKPFSGGGPEPASVAHVNDAEYGDAEPCSARYVNVAILNVIIAPARGANGDWWAHQWCGRNVSGWRWALLRHSGLTGDAEYKWGAGWSGDCMASSDGKLTIFFV